MGVPITSHDQLYYLFPFIQQQQALSLIQTTIISAGVVLIVLLAGIVSLVTRWVVVPLRQAAQAASRLSAGDLDERMPARGTDDLAALANSFNDMAGSLQDKLRELEELSRVQRQFVSDVSHELRTPLTTIRIAADVLFEAKGHLDPAAGRSAELLQSQLERFEELLSDLLEISRHDANVATLDAESADVCDLVRRAAADAEQLAARKGTHIDFRLPPQPCVAEVDRRRVERILRNLLDNAVEHGEGRDVVVTVATDRDAVAVAVRDHGVGFGPGEQHLVFDRFWRADPARARTTGGTGLGLAIALEDARLHGGWLQAWGERGKGSVFRLTLPRTLGEELAGSPLPLGPDEAEVAAVAEHLVGQPGVSVAGFGLADVAGDEAGPAAARADGDGRPAGNRAPATGNGTPAGNGQLATGNGTAAGNGQPATGNGTRPVAGSWPPATGARPAARAGPLVAGAWRNVAAMADGGRRADATPARIRFTLLLGAILATLLATGCATIPSSGPVGSAPTPAPPAGGGVSGGGLIVEGPQPGWTPRAGRQRLSAGQRQFRASPRDRAGVPHRQRQQVVAAGRAGDDPGQHAQRVPADRTVFRPGEPGQRQVSWQELATLDASGQYTARGGAARQQSFALESVNGQWRIDDVPSTDGSKVSHELLLPAALFRLDYAPRNLYFYGQPGGQLPAATAEPAPRARPGVRPRSVQ